MRQKSLRALASVAALAILVGHGREAIGEGEAPSWRPIGPWGGEVSLLVRDPHTPTRVWGVGSLGGQLHVSENEGRSWTWLGRGVGPRGIVFLTASPHTPDLLLAGTERDGVWRSLDGGRSWAAANHGLPMTWRYQFRRLLGLAFAPNLPGAAYALFSNGGVYVTWDNGEHWQPAYTFTYACPNYLNCNPMWAVMAVAPDISSTVLIAGDRLYRCNSNPMVCTPTTGPFTQTPWRLDALPYPGGTWLALDSAILTSPDSGSTWYQADEGLDELTLLQQGYPHAKTFQLDPSSGEVFALTDIGLLRRDAARQRWELVDFRPRSSGSNRACGWTVLESEHLFGCATLDAPSGWRAANAPVAWRGADQPLEERTKGFAARWVIGVLLSPHGDTPLLAATEHELYRWEATTAKWAPVLNWEHSATATLLARPLHPDHIFLAIDEGLFESRDGGLSWTLLPTPFEFNSDWVRLPLAVLGSDSSTLLAGGISEHLWRSEDLGRTWTKLPYQAQALWVSPHNPELVWATQYYTVRESRDSGRTWAPAAPTAADAWAQCPIFPCIWDQAAALAVDPFRFDRFFFGTHGAGVKRFSPQQGQTWLDTGLLSGRAIIPDPYCPGRILLAGYGYESGDAPVGRVLISHDAGDSWQPFGSNGGELPMVLEMAASLPHGRYAVASAAGVFVLEDAPRENRPARRQGPTRR